MGNTRNPSNLNAGEAEGIRISTYSCQETLHSVGASHFFLPLLNSDSLKYVFCKGIKFKHLGEGGKVSTTLKIFFNLFSDLDCFTSFRLGVRGCLLVE